MYQQPLRLVTTPQDYAPDTKRMRRLINTNNTDEDQEISKTQGKFLNLVLLCCRYTKLVQFHKLNISKLQIKFLKQPPTICNLNLITCKYNPRRISLVLLRMLLLLYNTTYILRNKESKNNPNQIQKKNKIKTPVETTYVN